MRYTALLLVLSVATQGCRGGRTNLVRASATATALALLVGTKIAVVPDATPVPISPPTGSGAASAAPASVVACYDGSHLDAATVDVTVPDDTTFHAGQSFSKTWRLRNNGTCTWTTSYQFGLVPWPSALPHNPTVTETSFGSPAPVLLSAETAPGKELEITVANITAPAAPGKYRAYWQLRNPAGQAFGRTPYVQIKVVP